MSYPVYYNGEITITPPLSEEHAATLMAVVNHEQIDSTHALLTAIALEEDASSLPRYSLFELSEARDTILPEESESRHGLGLSLRLLQQYFFVPFGYALNGAINWGAGDDTEDRGSIYLKDGLIEAVYDRIVNDGPSWSPFHYADEELIKRLQQLVDSSDDTGCSADLTVVASESVEAIRAFLRHAGVKSDENLQSDPSPNATVVVPDPRPYADYFAATAEAHRRADSTRTTHYVHEDLDPSLAPAFRVNQDHKGAIYIAVPEEI